MDGRMNNSIYKEETEDANSNAMEIDSQFERLTPQQLREEKETLLNIVSSALIQQPRVSVTDPTMLRITVLARRIAFYDPEFVMKMAVYLRLDLNIRSTANYLLALACNLPECTIYVRKYFGTAIRLPSDWLEVAATYLQLPNRQLYNEKSFPTCLRKAMVDKFPDFDAYQLGKYNKEKSMKRKAQKSKEVQDNKSKNLKTRNPKAQEKPMLTIKQMIRVLHISNPSYNVMCLLGKKYPKSAREFEEMKLPGTFVPEKAGTRMKLPVPETWETLLSAKGNKADTWEELIEHKKLPFMAMLRNLRNLILTGVEHKYHRWVQNKLKDPVTVANSRQFPFQFFSAYEVIPLNMEHFRKMVSGDDKEKKDAKKDTKKDNKTDDKKGQEKRRKKKQIITKHLPTDKIFSDYRSAIDQAVKLATIHNVSPIRGSTVVFCNVSKETQNSAPAAKGIGSVRKIQEIGYLLGLMCKYVCEDCDFRIFSSPSPNHPKSHLAVELIEGSILENMKVVAEKSKVLGEDSQFPFDYIEDMIREKKRVDNFLVLSHTSVNPEGESRLSNLISKYRAEVNPDMLFVSVDLSGSGRSTVGSDEKHPLDIMITGFSDQILRFIAERGDKNQLQYVENIDKAHNLNEKPKKSQETDISPWWRWLDKVSEIRNSTSTITHPNIVLHSPSRQWKTARVFISSTFLDMNGERDVLTRIVFPELKELAKKRKIEIFEVDLRWGVTEEESASGKSIQLCLEEVERCKPFFVGILGDRYGWAPENWNDVPKISKFQWIHEYPTKRSITELEIYLAALKDPYSANDGTFFYFRSDQFKNQLKEVHHKVFLGKDQEETEKMNSLKQRIRESNYPFFENYPATLIEEEGKPIASDLTEFSNQVFKDLWGAIDRKFPKENPETDPLEIERNYHQSFAYSLTRNFVGRKSVLDQLHKWSSSPRGKILLLTGRPGDGKSSLLANFAHDYAEKNSKVFVLPHFIGASPGSTDIRKTLQRLCNELISVFKIEIPDFSGIPDDYKELEALFPKVLEEVSFKGKLLIIIDAINQLDNNFHRSHLMSWLPKKLPCKIILSSTFENVRYPTHPTTEALQKRFPFSEGELTEIRLTPLEVSERCEVIRRILWQYHKKLDERPMGKQMSVLVKKTDAGSPLFLSVACEELRLFGHFDEITKRISSLSPTLTRLFDEVLTRLERDHGKKLVQDTCSLILVSRHGMFDSEILSITHTAPSTWLPFLRSLSPFLQSTGEDGELQFFHDEFKKATEKRYLPNPRLAQKYHATLASHFHERADPVKSGEWARGNDRRAISELPYHLLQSENYGELTRVLCDLTFIELKISQNQIYELIEDYNMATMETMKYDGISDVKSFKDFVRSNSHVLRHNPLLTFQQAINQPQHTKPAQKAQEIWSSGEQTHSWLEWLNKPRETDNCKMTFSGFSDGITAAAFSDDGKVIAAATRDCIIRLFDTESGSEKIQLIGHSGWISDIKFSLDSSKIVSASWDGTAKVWDTYGTLLCTLSDHARRVNSVCFSSDGQLLATGSWDCSVKIWQTNDLSPFGKIRPITTIRAGDRPVNSCTFVPGDKEIAVGTWNGAISVFHIESGEFVRSYSKEEGHTKSIQSIAFSPSGIHVISGSLDRKLILWDAVGGKAIATLSKHTKEVTSVAYTKDGSHVISTSADGTTKVWSGNLGSEKRVIEASDDGYLNSCAFDPTNSMQGVVGTSHGNLIVWNFGNATKIRQIEGHTQSVNHVCYSPQGNYIASSADDSTVCIWNSSDGSLVYRMKDHGHPVKCAAFSSDGNTIISGGDDNTVIVWNPRTGAIIRRLSGHTSTVRSVAFDPRDKLIASVSRDGTLRLWDSRNGNSLNELRASKDWLSSVHFSKAGTRVITGSWDHTMYLWNTRKTEPEAILTGHESLVSSCKFFADDKHIVSGSLDGKIKVWDAQSKSEVTTLNLPGNVSVHCIDVSSDGKVLSVSDDGNIRLWDPLSATDHGTLTGHSKPVRSAVFSPTSTKQILTAGDDKSMKLWDIGIGKEDDFSSSSFSSSFSSFSSFSSSSSSSSSEVKQKQPLGNLDGHTAQVNDLKLFSGGQKIVTVSDDGTLCQWDTSTLERINILSLENEKVFKSCDVSSDGNLIVGSCDDGVVSLWDARSWRKVRDIATHTGPSTCAVFSPKDNYTVISCGWDNKLILSDSRQANNTRSLISHTDWILGASISSDGLSVASCGWDKSVCLWNTQSATLRNKLSDVSTHTLTSVSFSSSGRYFAASSYDGTVKLWNSSAPTQRPQLILTHKDHHVNRTLFVPGSSVLSESYFMTGGSDNLFRLWEYRDSKGILRNEFVCQAPVISMHSVNAQGKLLIAVGDSIGKLYLTKYQFPQS